MKNKNVLLIICLLVIICLIIIFIISKNRKKNVQQKDSIHHNSTELIENSDSKNLSEQKIENLKQDLGYNNNTDTKIYEIKNEYDGREILTIKPNIQYKVAIAGAIKNAKPEFSELDKLLEQSPNESGIWITEDSREKVLRILKEITKANYKIDNKGYLVQENNKNANEIDEKIKKIINEKKLYIIDIDKSAYIVDEVTGNIEEYPFEEIDPHTPFEMFETENASVYIVTENTHNILNSKFIIEEILNTINN